MKEKEIKSVPTRVLWELNSLRHRLKLPNGQVGAELMRRTDRSPERIARSNQECAERANTRTWEGA